MFSIDQNCHSLWDVLPKLQAIGMQGCRVTHFVEDIDVAFTSVGSDIQPLLQEQFAVARERFYAGGGQDWGAALFYSEFLGRLPLDVKRLEPYLGMKLSTLARQIGRTLDDIYDEFSPGDNWQLIGPSYVGDRLHHRLIGDLTAAQVEPFLREIFSLAERDLKAKFPQADSQKRLAEWFARERKLMERLFARHAGGRLVNIYRSWLEEYATDWISVDMTSSLLATGADPMRTALLELFTTHYHTASELYNRAILEADVGLRPLNTDENELPFFAVVEHAGHLTRTPVFLRDGHIAVGETIFRLTDTGCLPTAELADAGIKCLAGKAALLVLQACIGPGGNPLAMPHNGSLYMPAAEKLAGKLAARRLLPGKLHPVVRVRFNLLDAMKLADTAIRLPDYLAAAFGADELPAKKFADSYRDLVADAGKRLENFCNADFRIDWQRKSHPDIASELDELDAARRRLAKTAPKSQQIRQMSHRVRHLQAKMLESLLRQVVSDWHISNAGYWDSRGPIWPVSVALGGEGFYNQLLAAAEITHEPLHEGHDHE